MSGGAFGNAPRISADALRVVREPLRLAVDIEVRADPADVVRRIHVAARGPALDDWSVPRWLLPHQRDAARRIAGALRALGGALLSDAVGMGKTYVALAVATRYHGVTIVAPASLLSQWRRVGHVLDVRFQAVSHEALSRGAALPAAALVIVDEAHRFRNTATRRYGALARGLRGGDLLLVTATPVVNRPEDLVALFRLFLPDHGLAALGVRSLERASADTSPARLLSAALPLTVARPIEILDAAGPVIPHVDDRHVTRTPPVPAPLFQRLVRCIDRLEFPGFGDPRASVLLAMHLVHRLSSSAAAFRQSVKRHLAYLDRAQAAAVRGETLARTAARRLFGPNDELQLELGHVLGTASEVPPERALERERQRLLQLLDMADPRSHPDPKAARLRALLEGRSGRKTIVFTAAETTALHLARQTGWRQVAVVAAGRARVASGRIAVERALGLFAPGARGARPPGPTLEVDTLIATDLVSEGLDLQDADAIVHYDLPWTPERLTQRLGRIARLGSCNRHATVFWFLPPEVADHRLRMVARLDAKAARQLALPVPSTSRVGKARVANRPLAARVRLLAGTDRKPRERPGRCRFAVVLGPPAAVAAVVWKVGDIEIPQVVALAGSPPREVPEVAVQDRLVERLAHADPVVRPPPARLLGPLLAVLRNRLRAAAMGPTDAGSRRLRRFILAAALEAGKRREAGRVDALDAVLDRLQRGTRVGAVLGLAETLSGPAGDRDIAWWLHAWPPWRGAHAAPHVAALLFGDGTMSYQP